MQSKSLFREFKMDPNLVKITRLDDFNDFIAASKRQKEHLKEPSKVEVCDILFPHQANQTLKVSNGGDSSKYLPQA